MSPRPHLVLESPGGLAEGTAAVALVPYCREALSELFSHLSLAVGRVWMASAALGDPGVTFAQRMHRFGGRGLVELHGRPC